VVKDPVSGEFFRFQEVERFIAEQLDGDNSLDVIRLRAEENFAAALAPEALARFVKTLDDNGLLESGPGERARRRRKRKRLAGNLLHLRFRLIDPAPLLIRLARPLRFLFTRGFIFISAALVVAAIAVCALEWNALAADAESLFQLSTLPLLAVAVFAVISAHEFAHGLTCQHFGGQVREMGFMLLYFQPAFYCDVSDAWLFPEKSKRLWVGFAGPYFEMFLWGLATLTWRVTEPGTWIHQASLVVTVTSGIKTIFNFVPLIKLDGYYLLSDCLDIPNLRKKSFAYLGDFFRSLGGLLRPLPQVPRRERRIYLTYGLIAWIFSISILGYMGLMFGQFLIVGGERMAFFAFMGFLGFRFRGKLSKLAGGKPNEAGAERPARRPTPKVRARFLWLGAAGATLAVLFFVNMELRVAGSVSVLPQHNADVRAEIDGVIEEIFVDEGERVAKGKLVARLMGREYRAELEKTEAEIRQVRARLDLLTAGPTPKEIDVARAVVAKSQDRVTFARARRERSEALYKDQLIPFNDLDTARELETGAVNELTEAKSRLQLLVAGTRPEEIRAAVADLARLEAQRGFLKGQLERLDVFSPAAGVVTTPGRQLRGMVRQAITKGGLIAKVYEVETVTVEAVISEKEIADVRVGQTAAIKTRAYPERLFYGRVTQIAPTAQAAGATDSLGQPSSGAPSAAEGDKSAMKVRVLTEIDNREGLLKPGMTGMIKIDCGKRRIVDLVMRRLSRTFRVEFWSWW
jgi:putative peptide zinc metalloprotease protein